MLRLPQNLTFAILLVWHFEIPRHLLALHGLLALGSTAWFLKCLEMLIHINHSSFKCCFAMMTKKKRNFKHSAVTFSKSQDLFFF